MRRVKTLLCLLASLLLATEASAQGNPTGTVSGRVTGQDGAAIPGVTVTAASPNLQGVRSVTTTAVGDYIIPFLPPGEYTLTFELQGFKSAEQKTLVTAAGTVTLDAKLQIAGVAEAVTVTGSVADAFSAGVSAATTFKQALIDDLPLNRGIEATTALTPGRAAHRAEQRRRSRAVDLGRHLVGEPRAGQRRGRAGQRPPQRPAGLHRGLAAGNHHHHVRRLGRVRALQRRRRQRDHQVRRQPLQRHLPHQPGQRQLARADAVPRRHDLGHDRAGLRVHRRRPGVARSAVVLHRRPLPERDA